MECIKGSIRVVADVYRVHLPFIENLSHIIGEIKGHSVDFNTSSWHNLEDKKKPFSFSDTLYVE